MGRHRLPLAVLSCTKCGKTFERKSYEVRSQYSFCSMECFRSYHKNNGKIGLLKALLAESKTYTLQELGSKVGLSRERIRQLCKKYQLTRTHPDKRHFCPMCGKQTRQKIEQCIDCIKKQAFVQLTCFICSKSFQIRKADYKRRTSIRKVPGYFCSRKCYGVYIGKTNGWGSLKHPIHYQVKKELPTYSCHFCGKEFKRYTPLAKQNDKHFCSISCVGSARIGMKYNIKPGEKRQSEIKPKETPVLITLHCSICNKEFIRSEQNMKMTAGKYGANFKFWCKECRKKDRNPRHPCSLCGNLTTGKRCKSCHLKIMHLKTRQRRLVKV